MSHKAYIDKTELKMFMREYGPYVDALAGASGGFVA